MHIYIMYRQYFIEILKCDFPYSTQSYLYVKRNSICLQNLRWEIHGKMCDNSITTLVEYFNTKQNFIVK